jgi:hypothetical protein
MASASYHYARKDLNSFFIALHDLSVHTHGITDREIRGFLAKLFGFDFIK